MPSLLAEALTLRKSEIDSDGKIPNLPDKSIAACEFGIAKRKCKPRSLAPLVTSIIFVIRRMNRARNRECRD